MATTKEWASSHGICVADSVPAVDATGYEIHRTVAQIAKRIIVLHAITATGYGIDPLPVVDWLKEQGLWADTSPKEKAFLTATDLSSEELLLASWRQEAQWTLLWAIQKVSKLGLPINTCDTAKLVNEIMPSLGESVEPFISSGELRDNSELLAEEDRIYNLHCYARQAQNENTMPEDLNYNVLFQRHYAFEWLSGDDWDNVQTDT